MSGDKNTITYAITVCTELEEITKLLNFLQLHIRPEDEILVQYDVDNVTDEVLEYLKIVDKLQGNHRIIGFPLMKDFATFKNNLKSHCNGSYIFQLDADELPHEYLIENLGTMLDKNPVDLVFVPRINTVNGITPEHIKKWGWKLNEKNWVNFPDYQTRVYKNTPDITWMGTVHEKITGYTTFSNFPPKEEWCLYHHKEIGKQEKQNEFYETI